MSTLLIVNSSPRHNSVSRRLAQQLAEEWLRRNPQGRVIDRDLAAAPPPMVTEAWIQAAATADHQRTAEQNATLALSDTLIHELQEADLVVLAAPMHNFSIPASLKAWIDLVVRAGRTFRYTDAGPKGLLPAGKKVLLIIARGGAYGEGSPADFQLPYLRYMLAFVGLTDVTVIEADKQAFAAEAAQQSIERASRQLAAAAQSWAESMVA
jgi:FMN-dependent NADH-azoreductase